MEFYQLKPDDIIEFSAHIKQAKRDHIHRLNVFNERLIFNHLDEISFTDSHSCLFGQWVDSIQDAELKNTLFSHINIVHEQLHQQAQLVVTHKKSVANEAPHQYRRFIDLQEQFIHELDSLYDSIFSTRYEIDHLTGLPNKALSEFILNKDYSLFERNGGHYCIAMADIDLFKTVNDTFGHLTGDIVLRQVAITLSQKLRKYDSVCRYGGEEFIFSLPNTTLAKALEILNRIRIDIQNSSISFGDGQTTSVTCSFGVAEFSTKESLESMLIKADQAMYLSKEKGRNQVTASE